MQIKNTVGETVKQSVEADLVWAIAFVFFLFWLESGWYRVDCALGVERACQLIAAEKEYSVKPEGK